MRATTSRSSSADPLDVKLTSRGTVFFKHERIGRDGQAGCHRPDDRRQPARRLEPRLRPLQPAPLVAAGELGVMPGPIPPIPGSNAALSAAENAGLRAKVEADEAIRDLLAKIDKAKFTETLNAVSAKIDTKTLAQLYARAGSYGKAASTAQQYLKSVPGDKDMQLLVANAYHYLSVVSRLAHAGFSGSRSAHTRRARSSCHAIRSATIWISPLLGSSRHWMPS